MASNINPSLEPTKSLVNFRFWCQKVLPLVYDDSLSYYEVLGKMVVQLNDVIDNVNADTDNVLTLKDAFLELQTYVNNFFDDIDQLASYAERAEAAQTAANASAVNAATSASNASASSLAAMNARDAAVSAKQAAQTSENNASTAATNANTKANEAAQSAIIAQTAQASANQSATLAATDRSAAQTAASTATTKASEASTSATNAETSANNAAQSKEDAEEAANNIQENLDNIQQNTQDINNLKESFSELEEEIGIKRKSTNSIDVTRDSMNAGDTKTPMNAEIGDTIIIKASGNLNIQNLFLYAFNENDQAASIGILNIDQEKTIVAPYKITAMGVYFVNATYPSTLTMEITVIPKNALSKTIESITAKVIDNYIADTALEVNDFRVIDNILYRVITPIASGGTLTVGTNVVATTVADVLKSLLN